MQSMDQRVLALLLALVTVPATALGHPSHATPTPSGVFAGASPIGMGIGLVGLFVASGAVLLAREAVLDEGARRAGVVVGAVLLAVGGLVAFVLT